jgi:hypothetical protein
MKLKQSDIIQLFFEGEIEHEGITLKVVEEGEFEQDGKYQNAEIIFTDGERFYSSYIMRSGSPFTEWHYEEYGDADITEVVKKEITVTRWVAV